MCSVWVCIHTRAIPHLGVLTLAVPAWVQVADTCAQRGGDRVAGLPVTLWNAVVHSIHLLHKVLVQLQGIKRDTWQERLRTCNDTGNQLFYVCAHFEKLAVKPPFFKPGQLRKTGLSGERNVLGLHYPDWSQFGHSVWAVTEGLSARLGH